MKVTELIIGDWVKHINGNICVVSKIERGRGFACRIGNSEYLWNYNNKYEPIPLTEEILTVNGFKIDEIRDFGDIIFSCDDYDFNTLNCIKYGSTKGYYFSIANSDDSVYKKCIYIHELQHALRLCGLNDLADNFKAKEE